jgi:hypothetical protein
MLTCIRYFPGSGRPSTYAPGPSTFVTRQLTQRPVGSLVPGWQRCIGNHEDHTRHGRQRREMDAGTATGAGLEAALSSMPESVATKEATMGAKAEALAKQFEAKAHEATGVFEKLSDADWKKVTSAEKWSVGVVAHHVASAHEGIAGLIKTAAAGQSVPNFTMDMLHAMNAKHAQDFANCTKAETLALHRKNAASAAATVRGLDDAQLGRSGTILTGMPPMSAEQVISGILINHIDEHLGSIRATVRG